MLFSLFIFQENISVFSLDQDQASTALSWSKPSYYQGEEGNIAITFRSQCPEELKIYKIELQFDWITSQEPIAIDFSDDPVGIPSNDDHIFDTISFQVPLNTTEGIHNIIIRIEGQQHGLFSWYEFEWVSPLSQIEIKTDYQQFYNQLAMQISTILNEAHIADYKNVDAIELLDEATTEYSLAISLANQRRWEEAVSHLQQTQDYLDQAQEKEQLSTEDLTTAAITIIVLIIAGLLVSIILGRKSKN
jgi:hypothetical protein